jgi:hypothetical protein
MPRYVIERALHALIYSDAIVRFASRRRKNPSDSVAKNDSTFR